MAIIDRLSRIIHRSGSTSGSSGRGGSSSSSSDGPSNTSAAATNTPTPADLRSYQTAQARFAKKTHWLSNPSSAGAHDSAGLFSRATRKPKRSAKARFKGFHPSERELTEQNLHHQEILGMFTMKFGRSKRASCGGRSHLSGISPCNSRVPSVEICRSPALEEGEDEEDEEEDEDEDEEDEEEPYEQRRMVSFMGDATDQKRPSDRYS